MINKIREWARRVWRDSTPRDPYVLFGPQKVFHPELLEYDPQLYAYFDDREEPVIIEHKEDGQQ